MAFSICVVPVSPMRLEPSHRSEQTSQLSFGECCEVLETSKDFTKIKVLYDNYEGWCQSNQLSHISDAVPSSPSLSLTSEWSTGILFNGQPMHIPFGSSLSFFQSNTSNQKKYALNFNGSTWQPGHEKANEELIKRFSFIYLNSPYLWGGRSVFGVDCSGFTQSVFKFCGIHLHRDAYQQATQGEALGFIQEAKCGDLAFFDNEEGKITHVGIMLDAGSIIHSSGKVRVDTIDHSGIINSDTGIRTHKLRIIKRLF